MQTTLEVSSFSLEELTFGEAMVGTSCWNNSVARPLPVYERAGSANAQKEDKKQHTDESQFIKIMKISGLD